MIFISTGFYFNLNPGNLNSNKKLSSLLVGCHIS